MKKILLTVCTVIFSFHGMQVNGQSLKDLFNKENIMEAVGTVVKELDVIPENIEGEWSYSGIAVRLTGDNALANAASTFAAGQIEETLDGYLEKIGLRQDTFSYIFNADSTFVTVSGKIKFPGTYSFSPEDDSIILDYGKSGRLGGVSLRAEAAVSLTDMELLFNADKLLDFIEKISSVAGDTALKSVGALAGQYDGIKIGFELSRVQASGTGK